jgi:xylitol oxidase
LSLLEEQLASFDARPHRVKLFTMTTAHLQSLYPKLREFRNLLSSCDPEGKFRNGFLDTYLY